MAAKKRPNILLIMSDQHNKHLTGCYGEPVIQNPDPENIHYLASLRLSVSAVFSSGLFPDK
jgi:arylsulfatase A-like enzyme